ncbi:MAG: proline--tRNA ligase, partial [Clostridiales bacterium]|nr:proline--tRNA ligase [Clostridiales bacterium]
ICDMYAKWVQSYRALPLLINQWANVVRWEKTTRPFLRTSEFLWQEGHTVHATAEEAEEETLRMLNVYDEFAKNVLAIPMLTGRKSEKEKFAGAAATYSIEAMMLDGKSLQAGTTHFFGQNFSKAFDIKFLDKDGVQKHPYQTSWGVSTRLIGALIMAHGDERGLKLPPFVAPIQAVIIPVAMHKEGVLEKANEIKEQLQNAGIRVKLDDSENTPGWKFNEYEMKGVPIRVEIGPRDIENGVAVVARRDIAGDKRTVPLSSLASELKTLLQDVHDNMYKTALAFRDSHIKTVKNLDELKNAVDGGNFALSMWCGDRACEDKIKETMQVTSRNMPFDQTPVGDKCVCCGKKATKKIYWGRAY